MLQLGYSHEVAIRSPRASRSTAPEPTADHESPAPTSQRSARSPPRSARSGSPSPTRARASGTRTRRSSARKARRSSHGSGEAMKTSERRNGASAHAIKRDRERRVRGCRCSARASTSMPRSSTMRAGARWRPPRRSTRISRRAQDRRRQGGRRGGRQAGRRARARRRASRRWCSTAAATCITAGSRRWPTPPAKAGWHSRIERWDWQRVGDRDDRGRGRPVARRRRTGRQAGQHQPRRQGGEGRPAVRLRRAGRRRRQQGPGRLRLGQGARGAGGDPQGDRAGQAQHDPRAAARGPDAASRRRRPFRRRPGGAARGAAGHRHHRRRADARGVRDAGRRRMSSRSRSARRTRTT